MAFRSYACGDFVEVLASREAVPGGGGASGKAVLREREAYVRDNRKDNQEMDLFSPAEFIDSYGTIGAGKAKAPVWKLFLLGIFAGLFIGLGGAAASTATHGMTNVGLIRMVSGLLFPFGLVMVILTGTELFTGNCLIAISVLEKRATVVGMARNLLVVYLGNFVGGLLLAAACAFCGQLNYSGGMLAVMSIKLAAGKCAMTFGNALVMGILCNILVCAAVMLSLCAKDAAGRAIGAYVPVAVFVICGFEHCVANMFYVPVGLFAESIPQYAALAKDAGIDLSPLTWGRFFLCNLLPVTLGNLIGGIGFGFTMWVCHKRKKQ